MAENLDEVEWVKELFPNARSYLDVYERFDLLIQMRYSRTSPDAQDRGTMARHGATMAFCPTSNLFWVADILMFRKLTGTAMCFGNR